MTVQLELWQLIALLLAFFGAVGAGAKLMLAQQNKGLDQRFAALQGTLDVYAERERTRDEAWMKLERDFLTFLARLPLEYVRKEDQIRTDSVTSAKLDALAAKIDLLQRTTDHVR